MSSSLPGFEQRLLDELLVVVDEQRAAAPLSSATAAPEERWWRRLRRRWGPLLALVVVISGGTAVATTVWHPQLGNDHDGRPSRASGALPGELTESLAVLRSAQQEADRGPRVREALQRLPAEGFSDVHVESVRLLQSWSGGASMVLIAEHAGKTGQGPLCLVVSSDYGQVNGTRVRAPSTGQRCGTVDDLRAGRLSLGAAIGGRLTFNALVPDGVARVEVPQTGGRPPIVAAVRNNAVHIDTPTRGVDLAAIRWLDEQGQPVEVAP